MKKAIERNAEEMQREYDFSLGERGRYAKRFAEGTNLVLLAPDVAEVFPDAESVNSALRLFVKVARQTREKSAVKR
jgi:hypothetical protein